METVIDAKDLIVGRLATHVAKRALLGDKLTVVNCEQALVTGNREQIIAKWAERRDIGQHQYGPFISRMPDRMMRRIIRGMLPYKQEKGKKAFGRVKCYIGVPDEFEKAEKTSLKSAHMSKLSNMRFMRIGELCKNLGGKS